MDHVETYLSAFKPQIEQLRDIITNHESFLIVGHSNPDGDCYGSLLSMGRRLQRQGKQVSYLVAAKKLGAFSFVVGVDDVPARDNGVHSIPDSQVVLFLDLCMIKRLSGLEIPLFAKQSTIFCCIDHHVQTQTFTSCDIVDTQSSSCCELIWELICYFDPNHTYIDDQIAGYCLLGTMTDTGDGAGFEHEKNSVRTFENALSMLQAGATKRKSHYVDNLRDVPMGLIQFTQLLWSRVAVMNNLVRTRYKDSEYEQYGLESEQAKWGFDVLKRTNAKDMYVRVVQYDNQRYVSMRSRGTINARLIAEHFGGGGHDRAAACSVGSDTSIDHIIHEIDALIQQQLSSSQPL
ncbi:MAG: DHH family phosphoesterase [Candidatus Absconditabacterales bacterium]